MSAILEWSPELELGLGGIDDQHRQLALTTTGGGETSQHRFRARHRCMDLNPSMISIYGYL